MKTFIAGELRKVLEMRDIRDKLADLGFGTGFISKTEAEGWLSTERARWSNIISEAGITAN